MRNLKIDIFFKIIFLISFISLISAIFIEYVLGHQPCNLCLIQRVPYGLSIMLIIINYFHKKNEWFVILLLNRLNALRVAFGLMCPFVVGEGNINPELLLAASSCSKNF